MHALIDADRLAYAFGGMTDDDGLPLSWTYIAARIRTNIEDQLEAVGAEDSYQLYLTSDDKTNFRIRVATIRPYKGNRSSTKPFWYEQIRRHLVDEWRAEVVSGMEADDSLGIAQMAGFYCPVTGNDTVICSVDKDLDMIPGLHYNELHPERGVYEISEITALQNFYLQLLTGDPTDAIPGLYGVGRSSKLCSQLKQILVELDMYSHVREQYEKRFGSYWLQFLQENAALLWIKRNNEAPNQPELESQLRILGLELQRLGCLGSEVA